MIKYVDEKEFNEEIKKKVLVDFFATWCGPCKMLGLELEKLDDKIDIPILKVDIDKYENLAVKYKIMSVPTLMIIENEKVIKKMIGYSTLDELIKWVNE